MQLNIQDAQRLLYQSAKSSSPTAALDAQVLLAHILEKSRSWVLAHPEVELLQAQTHRLEQFSARLALGEPLPYLLGSWEFFGLKFIVTPDVLIPRPETELMIEHALIWLRANPGRRRAADVGTGSACIAVSLAVQISDLHVTATDISQEALQVARQNVHRHGLEKRIHLTQTDLLAGICPPIGKQFDVICANLPYVPNNTLERLSVSHWEPRLALYGGQDGLDLIRRLFEETLSRLSSGGLLLLEIEARQGEAVAGLAYASFPTSKVSVLPDLEGRDRLVAIHN